ncbi:MAG: hypothetical protein IJ727_08010 [Treponema sp.]|nr:hypothetical protein [Treponema sp.]
MSLNPDGREKKIGFISDTMTGFYSVMRNLQEDYKTYSKNYSEEALALLSRSDDFIESVEAVRSLDSLSRIDDKGINELFLLSQQIAELYHLNVQERDKENPVTEVKSEKGFWQTVWGVMKGGRDSPVVKNTLERLTGAIADIGEKLDGGLKGGVDWVIEHEPDSPVYQSLCNPLFNFFMAGGAIQSRIQNGNIADTSKKAVENSKAFRKGLYKSFIEVGTGILSLPKTVVDLYYKECEIGDNIAAYLDTCEPSEIPDDLKQWFTSSKKQAEEFVGALKDDIIEQLSEKDVKDYYELAGYLTGTIASFFIGTGEAKVASKAGKAGKIGKAAASETKATEQLAADVKKVAAKLEKKAQKTEKRKLPEWLKKRFEAGNNFNKENRPRYTYNEVEVIIGNNKYVVDSYIPDKEIISRKYSQLANIKESTAIGYLRELEKKYPPGAKISDRVFNSKALRGKTLEGIPILEVPVQNKPIPQSIIDKATEKGIIIRDVLGKEYN